MAKFSYVTPIYVRIAESKIENKMANQITRYLCKFIKSKYYNMVLQSIHWYKHNVLIYEKDYHNIIDKQWTVLLNQALEMFSRSDLNHYEINVKAINKYTYEGTYKKNKEVKIIMNLD